MGGVGEVDGLQEESVRDAKNRRVRANSEREHHHRNGGETRRLSERSKREANVFPEGFHGRYITLLYAPQRKAESRFFGRRVSDESILPRLVRITRAAVRLMDRFALRAARESEQARIATPTKIAVLAAKVMGSVAPKP